MALSRYWKKKKNLKRSYGELKKATGHGQLRYDPSLLHSQVKMAIKLGRLGEALKLKDRYLQVESRLPSGERGRRTGEMYRLFGKSYEHLFYKKRDRDPEGDYVYLLDKAIDLLERCDSYLGGDTRARKEIVDLEKMKQEMSQ